MNVIFDTDETCSFKFSSEHSSTPAIINNIDLLDTLLSGSDVQPKLDENEGVRRSGTLSMNRMNQASPKSSANMTCSLDGNYIVNGPSSSKSSPLSTEGASEKEVHSSPSGTSGELSNTSSSRSDVSMKLIDEGPVHEDMHDPIDFAQYFQEGYCKASANNELTEAVTDIDSSNSPYDREKAEEDAESDFMLGGVFFFSEEGTQSL